MERTASAKWPVKDNREALGTFLMPLWVLRLHGRLAHVPFTCFALLLPWRLNKRDLYREGPTPASQPTETAICAHFKPGIEMRTKASLPRATFLLMCQATSPLPPKEQPHARHPFRQGPS